MPDATVENTPTEGNIIAEQNLVKKIWFKTISGYFKFIAVKHL